MALGDSRVDSCVDKLESTLTVLIDLGDDTHMAYTVTNSTTSEEHEVARLQVFALHATSIINLRTAASVQIDAKLLKDIACKT